jgi:hypothetical protein
VTGQGSVRVGPGEIGRARRFAIGVGVVACVLVALGLSLIRIDSALGLFDFRADTNASRTYLDRLYGEPFDILGDHKVVVDALLWMPEDASYRVVVGPARGERSAVAQEQAPEFLRFVLLPRRRTDDGTAPWIFCFGCDPSSLPPGFEVLSEGGGGVLFGRVRR